MDEYGLFNDEGCVERGFWSLEEAWAAEKDRYSPEDDLSAFALCRTHGDHAAVDCEECFGEEE